MLKLKWVPAAVAFASAFAALPAHAQQTRAEVVEKERAEKASQLTTYKPGKIEQALIWYERNNPLQMIAPRNGFYIQYGYTGKPIGSGIAFGGGWRHDLFDQNARLVFEVGRSLRSYQVYR